jgi:aldehyde dehydrogenase (NAD+)
VESSEESNIARYQLFIDGKWQSGDKGNAERYSPAHNGLVASFSQASNAQTEQAVAAARTAFDSGSWSDLDGAECANIMLKFADLLMANQQRLGQLESMTLGAPLKYGCSFIKSAADTFRYFAGLARDLHGHSHQFGANRMGMTLKEPVGVVSLILPWNFPIGELAWKLAPALAAGCTVVVKPDSKTAATALEAGPLFKQAGLPDGVLNIIVGEVSEIGNVLTAHPDVDAVSFTGSSASGRQVMNAASAQVKPLHLELGGKSALIIMNDADIEKAATDAAFGVFWHNGQVCTACSRLLVHKDLYPQFVEALKQAAGSMKVGDPQSAETELGPMISDKHLANVVSYIELGQQQGAKLVRDGRKGMPDVGSYLGPTIFTDVTPDMTIAKEEIFGPVACVMAVDSLQQAIELANDTEYGLGAGIWTKNIDQAMLAARKIRSGSFWINGYGSERLEMPWGGYKQSGFGRELGREAFEVFMQTKSVHMSLTI